LRISGLPIDVYKKGTSRGVELGFKVDVNQIRQIRQKNQNTV